MSNENLGEHIRAHAVYDVLKAVIAGVVGLSLYMTGSTKLDLLPFFLEYKWAIALVVGIGTSFSTFLLTSRKRNQRRPVFPNIDYEFQVLKHEIVFKYRGPLDITYSRKYTLRALRNGCNRFSDKYRWTGSAVKRVFTPNPQHKLRLTDQKNVFQHLEIMFNQTLHKDKTVEVEICWELEDRDFKMSPFISARIEYPTDFLSFLIQLDEMLGVQKVVREVGPGHGATNPFASDMVELVNGRDLWTISTPKLLHLYEVHWIPVIPNEQTSTTTTKSA